MAEGKQRRRPVNAQRLRRRFGANVRVQRQAQGLSQQVLARRIAITQSSLSAIENGECFVTARTLAGLATVLGCAPGDLFEATPTRKAAA